MLKKILPFLLLLPLTTPVYASDLSTGWYTITAAKSSIYRMSAESDSIQLQNATNKANQKFQIVKLSEGVYRIGTGNTAGMSVLTVEDGDIIQKKYSKLDNQKWNITKTENGTYIIQNADKYLSYSALKNKALLSLTDDIMPNKMSEFRISPYTDKATVTFRDNGNLIKRKSVIKGGSVEYSLANKEDAVFEGWDVDLTEIKSNITANAVWRNALMHRVIFMDDEDILFDGYIEDGESANAPDITVKEEKEFIGWDKSFDNITEDLTINAVWKDEEEEHQHNWQPVYKTVHHEEVSHKEEYQEPYTYTSYVDDYEVYYCTKDNWNGYSYGKSYGIYTTESEASSTIWSLTEGYRFCYRTHQSPVTLTDYETKTRTVIDYEAYDEEVIDYYICECGETNSVTE